MKTPKKSAKRISIKDLPAGKRAKAVKGGKLGAGIEVDNGEQSNR